MNIYYVYILGSTGGTLYIGVTNDLERRLFEHKHKMITGFTAKYNVNRLLYFEDYGEIYEAIAREKELKGWLRKKKLVLIRTMNPTFRDLSEDWELFSDQNPCQAGQDQTEGEYRVRTNGILHVVQDDMLAHARDDMHEKKNRQPGNGCLSLFVVAAPGLREDTRRQWEPEITPKYRIRREIHRCDPRNLCGS